MKKVFALVSSVAILITVSIHASAVEINSDVPDIQGTQSVLVTAFQKQMFSTLMDAKYTNAVSNNELLTATKDEIDDLILKAEVLEGSERIGAYQQLEQYGVYLMKTPYAAAPMAHSGDVTLNKPSVLYEAKDRTWTVSCGGQWKNNNAFSGTHTYGNIGGRDGFGVGYTNTGNYGKTVVQYTKAYIYDKSLKKSSSTNNRSDGDGKKGFAFELQDYTYGRNGTTEYVGYKWTGLCRYSTSFASYSGVATAFYIHTSSSAQITGIKFGVSGKVAGLDIDISNVAKSFTAYSTDTRFGV